VTSFSVMLNDSVYLKLCSADRRAALT
jgi:hypothetical protein